MENITENQITKISPFTYIFAYTGMVMGVCGIKLWRDKILQKYSSRRPYYDESSNSKSNSERNTMRRTYRSSSSGNQRLKRRSTSQDSRSNLSNENEVTAVLIPGCIRNKKLRRRKSSRTRRSNGGRSPPTSRRVASSKQINTMFKPMVIGSAQIPPLDFTPRLNNKELSHSVGQFNERTSRQPFTQPRRGEEKADDLSSLSGDGENRHAAKRGNPLGMTLKDASFLKNTDLEFNSSSMMLNFKDRPRRADTNQSFDNTDVAVDSLTAFGRFFEFVYTKFSKKNNKKIKKVRVRENLEDLNKRSLVDEAENFYRSRIVKSVEMSLHLIFPKSENVKSVLETQSGSFQHLLGVARMSIRLSRHPESPLCLDFGGDCIIRLAINGRQIKQNEIFWDKNKLELAPNHLKKGENTVEIFYGTSLILDQKSTRNLLILNKNHLCQVYPEFSQPSIRFKKFELSCIIFGMNKDLKFSSNKEEEYLRNFDEFSDFDYPETFEIFVESFKHFNRANEASFEDLEVGRLIFYLGNGLRSFSSRYDMSDVEYTYVKFRALSNKISSQICLFFNYDHESLELFDSFELGDENFSSKVVQIYKRDDQVNSDEVMDFSINLVKETLRQLKELMDVDIPDMILKFVIDDFGVNQRLPFSRGNLIFLDCNFLLNSRHFEGSLAFDVKEWGLGSRVKVELDYSLGLIMSIVEIIFGGLVSYKNVQSEFLVMGIRGYISMNLLKTSQVVTQRLNQKFSDKICVIQPNSRECNVIRGDQDIHRARIFSVPPQPENDGDQTLRVVYSSQVNRTSRLKEEEQEERKGEDQVPNFELGRIERGLSSVENNNDNNNALSGSFEGFEATRPLSRSISIDSFEQNQSIRSSQQNQKEDSRSHSRMRLSSGDLSARIRFNSMEGDLELHNQLSKNNLSEKEGRQAANLEQANSNSISHSNKAPQEIEEEPKTPQPTQNLKISQISPNSASEAHTHQASPTPPKSDEYQDRKLSEASTLRNKSRQFFETEDLVINELAHIYIALIRQELISFEQSSQVQPLLKEYFCGEAGVDELAAFTASIPTATKLYKLYFLINQFDVSFKSVAKNLGEMVKAFAFETINWEDFASFLSEYAIPRMEEITGCIKTGESFDQEAEEDDLFEAQLTKVLFDSVFYPGINTVSVALQKQKRVSKVEKCQLTQKDLCHLNAEFPMLRLHKIELKLFNSKFGVQSHVNTSFGNGKRLQETTKLRGEKFPKGVLINSSLRGFLAEEIDSKSLNFFVEGLYNLKEAGDRFLVLSYLVNRFYYLEFMRLSIEVIELETNLLVLEFVLKNLGLVVNSVFGGYHQFGLEFGNVVDGGAGMDSARYHHRRQISLTSTEALYSPRKGSALVVPEKDGMQKSDISGSNKKPNSILESGESKKQLKRRRMVNNWSQINISNLRNKIFSAMLGRLKSDQSDEKAKEVVLSSVGAVLNAEIVAKYIIDEEWVLSSKIPSAVRRKLEELFKFKFLVNYNQHKQKKVKKRVRAKLKNEAFEVHFGVGDGRIDIFRFEETTTTLQKVKYTRRLENKLIIGYFEQMYKFIANEQPGKQEVVCRLPMLIENEQKYNLAMGELCDQLEREGSPEYSCWLRRETETMMNRLIEAKELREDMG